MKRTILISVAVALAISAGTAVATTQVIAAGGVINGCYRVAEDDRKGELRVVNDPASCRSNELPIAWNVQGPKGDKGEPGPAGPPAAVNTVVRTSSTQLAPGTVQSPGYAGMQAVCEPGEQVVGGGVEINDVAHGQYFVTASFPGGRPASQWVGGGANTGPTTGSLSVHVICLS